MSNDPFYDLLCLLAKLEIITYIQAYALYNSGYNSFSY